MLELVFRTAWQAHEDLWASRGRAVKREALGPPEGWFDEREYHEAWANGLRRQPSVRRVHIGHPLPGYRTAAGRPGGLADLVVEYHADVPRSVVELKLWHDTPGGFFPAARQDVAIKLPSVSTGCVPFFVLWPISDYGQVTLDNYGYELNRFQAQVAGLPPAGPPGTLGRYQSASFSSDVRTDVTFLGHPIWSAVWAWQLPGPR